MKKVLFLMFLLFLFLGTVSVNAQVRIGGNAAPDAAAVLDLNADGTATGTKGLALPRVSLSSNTVVLPGATANLNGMLVYNTGGTLTAGVYYWTGSVWMNILTGAFVEGDGVIGNEITNVTATGGLERTGAGTAASPYLVGIKAGGAVHGSILLYDGSSWVISRYPRPYQSGFGCDGCPGLAVGSTVVIPWTSISPDGSCDMSNTIIADWNVNNLQLYRFYVSSAGVVVRKEVANSVQPWYLAYCFKP